MVRKEVLSGDNFHSISQKEIFSILETSEKGLFDEEAKSRQEKYGLNEITEKRKYPYLLSFIRQFKSFFVYILLIAAGISYYVGNYIDVYVIFAVIVINVSIGFGQEKKAEGAMRSLKKMVVSYAKVYRNNSLKRIDSKELVIGDIISLEEGDRIPAAARLIKINNFKTIESSLTGESLPVEKILKNLPQNISLADRKNLVYSGTFVASGTALAIIIKTGDDTEIGKIAKSLEGIKKSKNHFQTKINKLAFQMGLFAMAGALITFLIGFFYRGFEFTNIFLFTLSSLVAGIPEGLPAVLSIVLAIGAVRMSKKNAIIRNLPSTETLGVVNTIITDKTGTLTENTMTVKKIYLSNGDKIDVDGIGWSPEGNFKKNNSLIPALKNNDLSKLLHISLMSSNAKLLREETSKGNYSYSYLGDPTEAALVVLAEKAGLKKGIVENSIKILDEIPFDSELKYKANLSSLVNNNGNKELYVIGSPEQVLEKCKFKLKNGRKILFSRIEKAKTKKVLEKMTSDALRVIAIAYKEERKTKKEIDEEDVNDLIFVGFTGMIDPPRKGVDIAIEKAKNAGIRVIMATGDHKNTAIAIAKNIGLMNDEKAYDQVELEKLSSVEFKKVIRKTNVFARLNPSMKLRIAEELQKDGLIVAMTGDGVNDAAALKKSDIGISMGITGTDVARDSSEMVLADDNFSTIVNAIEEGRIVFSNTKRTSFFLITTNVAEDITIIASLVLGLPLPLLPIQLLWLNLVTDTGPGIGLATEPGHEDVLNKNPRNAKENILTKEIFPFLILISGLMVFITVIIFNNFLSISLEKARTGAFLAMSFTQIYNAFNLRSIKFSIFKLGILKNKTLIIATLISIFLMIGLVYIEFFQNLFSFAHLSIYEFLFILLISSSVLIVGEIYKFFARKLYYKI